MKMKEDMNLGFWELLFQLCFVSFVYSTLFSLPITLFLSGFLDVTMQEIMICTELTAFIVLLVAFYIDYKRELKKYNWCREFDRKNKLYNFHDE